MKKISEVEKIAKKNPNGFTIDAKTLVPVKRGFAVAKMETQNSFGKNGLKRVLEYICDHPEVSAIGGWRDGESGLYYYDACVIVEIYSDALTLARVNKQIAFFSLDEEKEYRIK